MRLESRADDESPRDGARGSASITSNTFSPNALTIFLAQTGRMLAGSSRNRDISRCLDWTAAPRWHDD